MLKLQFSVPNFWPLHKIQINTPLQKKVMYAIGVHLHQGILLLDRVILKLPTWDKPRLAYVAITTAV